MTGTGKRVEVRFGTFSCSIEGYDDPVERMREVLLLMQRLIRETPALADHGPEFGDADLARIESALESRHPVRDGEAPGLIVLRTGGEPNGRAEPEDAVTTAEFPPEGRLAPGPDSAAAWVAPVPSDDDAQDEPDAPEDDGPLQARPEEEPNSAAMFSAPSVEPAEEALSGVATPGSAGSDAPAEVADHCVPEDRGTDEAGQDNEAEPDRELETFSGIAVAEAVRLPETEAAAEPDTGSGEPGTGEGALTSAESQFRGAIPETPGATGTGLSARGSEAPDGALADSDPWTASWGSDQPGEFAPDDHAEVEPESGAAAAEEMLADDPARAGPAGHAPANEPQEPGRGPAENLHDSSPAAGADPRRSEAGRAESDPTAAAASGDHEEDSADPADGEPAGPAGLGNDAGAEGSGEGSDRIGGFAETGATEDALTSHADVSAAPAGEGTRGPAESGARIAAVQNIFAPPPVSDFGAAPAPDIFAAIPGNLPTTAINVFAPPQADPSARTEVSAPGAVAASDVSPDTFVPPASDEPAGVFDQNPPEAGEDLSFRAGPADDEGRSGTRSDAHAAESPAADGQPGREDAAGRRDEDAPASTARRDGSDGAEFSAGIPSASTEDSAPAVNIFSSPQPQPAEQESTGTDVIHDVGGGEHHGQGRFASLLARLGGRRSPETAAPEASALRSTPGLEAGPAGLAERAGARSVSELLMVAAAWLTLAEGKARFTRREVMETFERLPGDHPRTLEARIKGFGRLVRSSTLILVDDGAFALAQAERDRFQAMLDGH